MYNKIGAENERVSNNVPRDLPQFTYLGRAATFLNLGDAHSIDLGASYAYTPRVASEEKAHRHLAGLDITYRYVPPSQAAYRGLVWGTEVFYNRRTVLLAAFRRIRRYHLPSSSSAATPGDSTGTWRRD